MDVSPALVAFYIICFLILLLISSPYLYQKSRNITYRKLSKKYNLQISYDYKDTFWLSTPVEGGLIIRSLKGTLHGKNIFLSDCINSQGAVRPFFYRYLWRYYFGALPLSGSVIETRLEVEKEERIIQNKGFFTVFSLPSQKKLEAVLDAV